MTTFRWLPFACSARGHDTVAVVPLGMAGMSDRKLLEWATNEDRTILTHNTADFRVLHEEYIQLGWEHAGIIVSARIPFKTLLARTLRLLVRKRAEDLRTTLVGLKDYS